MSSAPNSRSMEGHCIAYYISYIIGLLLFTVQLNVSGTPSKMKLNNIEIVYSEKMQMQSKKS